MRRVRRQPIRPAARVFCLFLGLILLALSALIFVFDTRLKPIAQSVAGHQAKVAAIRYINSAMTSVLEEENVGYSDIVKVNQNADGRIGSLQSDMVLINRLKLKATDKIMEEALLHENQSIYIPLGNLLGIQLLAGRGPPVELKIKPVGYVQTRLHNQFTSAGINQTLHRVMLEAGTQVLVVLPGYSAEVSVLTDYCIAETLIVGEIPESFTGIHFDSTPTLFKVDVPE